MMKAEVMGGWLQVAGDIEIHSDYHGLWENTSTVCLPMDRTYIPMIALIDRDKIVGHKWHFLVFGESANVLPDRFTEGNLEYIKLGAVFDGSNLQFVHSLLAEALRFTRPGAVYSEGQFKEWRDMVRNYLKKVNSEIPDLWTFKDGELVRERRSE